MQDANPTSVHRRASQIVTRAPVARRAKQDADASRLEETPTGSIVEAAWQYSQVLESADVAAIAIYMALWQASRVQLLANHRAIEALDLPMTVTGGRLTVLRSLYFAEEDGMSLSEISRATGISRMMVLNLVDALETGGLVRRRHGLGDRRAHIAQLTASGRIAFLKILPVMSQSMAAACSAFTQEEKKLLFALLHRLSHA
jgi:DNA-binding MarR family transcriptional regulator